MSQEFSAIKIHPSDNVATLLRKAKKGEAIFISDPEGKQLSLVLKEDIPFGHKIALEPITGDVVKYGEVIGRVAAPVEAGDYVHSHNLESTRGRGDLKEEAGSLPSRKEKTARKSEKPLIDASGLTFMGYPRANGEAGTRNLVAVISTVVCANEICARMEADPEIVCFTHQQGCSQTRPDIAQVTRVLTNLALNPNVGAVIFVGLGCESVPSYEVFEAVKKTGKPAEIFEIQEEGGLEATVKKVKEKAQEFKLIIQTEKVPVPISKLRLGLKCGSSDTTQGLTANVIAGKITDILTAAGASVVMGETTEFLGAEHIAAANSRTPEVGAAILQKVLEMEERAKAVGYDMRGGQPTRGNIEGGLTTIEEKSLGALAKAGSSKFERVIDYGERFEGAGLTMMDSPGREPEMLTGLTAAGCNLILFTTGRGAPQGFPFVPVLKLTGNKVTWEFMQEHMDCFAGEIVAGTRSIADVTEEVFGRLMETASGKPVKAEIDRYFNSMNIYVRGPVI